MTIVVLVAWVACGLALVAPFGLLDRLVSRTSAIIFRGSADRPVSYPLGSPGIERAPWLIPQTKASRSLKLRGLLRFIIYVSFLITSILAVPQLLMLILDTPHPMAAVSSQSMWPALHKGDLIFLEGVDDPTDLTVGDIIAFEHPRGVTVHRIVQISGDRITTKGDANTAEDRPILFGQVVGRVLAIGGRTARLPFLGSIPGLLGISVTKPAQLGEGEALQSGGTASHEPSAELGASLPGRMELATVSSSGDYANGASTQPTVSADGNFVAFVSEASNLVSEDANGRADVFLRHLPSGTVERISGASGNEPDGPSGSPSVSNDGRFVAFVSWAGNLVDGDINSVEDVFAYDREVRATTMVSRSSVGAQADGASAEVAISGDGRYLVFSSEATNLVSDDQNGLKDVFLHDRSTGVTVLVSRGLAGRMTDGASSQPAISDDGRFVAFPSNSTNLVERDTNGRKDVFLWDRTSGLTFLASADNSGEQGDGDSITPSISADGRLVAFASWASNLVSGDGNRASDIFVRDTADGTTEIVSVNNQHQPSANGASSPTISADGRFVGFQAGRSNLTSTDSNRFVDVFVHDRKEHTTNQVTLGSSGEPGDDHSGGPAMNGNGSVIAFWSYATNLVLRAEYEQSIVVHCPR